GWEWICSYRNRKTDADATSGLIAPMARSIRNRATREDTMATHSVLIGAVREQARASWVPMIAIALGQMIMSFNVASLPVALGGMVKSFAVPPTTVATGIVAYSMLVAGFVMLGAKLAQRFGALQVFRFAVVLFCASQL